MRYSKARLGAIGYELAPNVVSSAELEARLAPVYQALHIERGQLEAFTGIRERRWWNPGFRLSEGAARAGRKALRQGGVRPEEVGLLIYAGVCRENFEPATACAAAESLGIGGRAAVYDLSNACLGVLNGILEAANRVELGQIRAGLVVSCESAREINELTIERLLEDPSMEHFKHALATLTGGSGAVAVLVTDGSFKAGGPRLLGGAALAAPEHHRICRWGLEPDNPFPAGEGPLLTRRALREVMRTDAVQVLKHGVVLGRRTWDALLSELGWTSASVDKVVCHQVGSGHQREILRAIEVSEDKDFCTYPFLGNIGTVSLPITAALAQERGFLAPGDRTAFLGIGSGLNCLMLGWEWQ